MQRVDTEYAPLGPRFRRDVADQLGAALTVHSGEIDDIVSVYESTDLSLLLPRLLAYSDLRAYHSFQSTADFADETSRVLTKNKAVLLDYGMLPRTGDPTAAMSIYLLYPLAGNPFKDFYELSDEDSVCLREILSDDEISRLKAARQDVLDFKIEMLCAISRAFRVLQPSGLLQQVTRELEERFAADDVAFLAKMDHVYSCGKGCSCPEQERWNFDVPEEICCGGLTQILRYVSETLTFLVNGRIVELGMKDLQKIADSHSLANWRVVLAETPSTIDATYYRAKTKPWGAELDACLDAHWMRCRQSRMNAGKLFLQGVREFVESNYEIRSTLKILDDEIEYRLLARPAVAPDAAKQPASRQAETEVNVFRRGRDFWTISFAGKTTQMKAQTGYAFIAELLRRPGEAISVEELDRLVKKAPLVHRGTRQNGHRAKPASPDRGSPVADPKTKAQVLDRMRTLRKELDEATVNGVASEGAKSELERLEKYIRSSEGLGGHSRSLTTSEPERARKRVCNAIDRAIDSLGADDHQALWLHLKNSLDLGRECTYRPEKTPRWDF